MTPQEQARLEEEDIRLKREVRELGQQTAVLGDLQAQLLERMKKARSRRKAIATMLGTHDE